MAKVEEEFRYMVRIAGTDLDGKKKVPYGLSKIRGIGTRLGEVICCMEGIDPSKKIGYLTEEEASRLDETIENIQNKGLPGWFLNRRSDYSTGKDMHVIGSDLVMSVRGDINLMKKIRSYKGIRHELGLPVRGQSTRTSFRTGTTVGVTRAKIKEAAKEKEKAEKEEKGKRAGKIEKVEKTEQVEKVEKTEKPGKPEKTEVKK